MGKCYLWVWSVTVFTEISDLQLNGKSEEDPSSTGVVTTQQKSWDTAPLSSCPWVSELLHFEDYRIGFAGSEALDTDESHCRHQIWGLHDAHVCRVTSQSP